jgi:LacI family transcriptional regulator
MDGLLDLVRQQRLRLLVDTAGKGEEEDAYSNLARAKRIDGLIIIEPRSDDTGLRAMIEDAFPVVLVGSLPDVETCSIDVDNRAAARAAVEHLLALGHTRIACITNAPLPYMSAAKRLLGYQDALAAAGIPLDETLVRYGKHTPESGFSRMNSLLGENVLPTAVFVASDVVAVGAIKAAKQAGLQIPEDLAVVGFDDIPLAAYLDPPLTTVQTSVYDMGWGAGEMLVRLIAHEEEIRDSQVILDTKLIVRKSCGARRGAD